MIPSQRTIRSVKDIRTHSGTPDNVFVPYKAYLAIGTLEMEKFRRETERKNLAARLEIINNRVRTIDAAKTALAQRLANEPAGKTIKSSLPTKESTPNGRVGGFKYQY